MSIAVFPGSFDPLTNGHLDIIKRASGIFEKVIVGVGNNTSKAALFTPQEKMTLISTVVKDLPNVEVAIMKGLTVQFMNEVGAKYIVRGLRNGKDFEYERDIAGMNSALAVLRPFYYLQNRKIKIFPVPWSKKLVVWVLIIW